MKVKLKEILDYEQPTKYIVDSENYSDEFKTPVLTAGKSFILGYTDEIKGVFEASKEPVIIFDDFTRDTKYVDFDFKVKSSAMKILHKHNENDSLKFFHYAIKSIKYVPFAHKRLWISDFSNIEIKYPNCETQQKIANHLDSIQAAIDNKQQQLKELDELVKSRFIEMFGDPHNNTKYTYKNVGDFTTVTSGGTPDRKNIEYWKNGNIPWVKTTELQNNELTNVEEFITQKGLDESSAKMMPIGTLLIAMYGQGKTRGMTAYLGIEASTNQACACILPSKVINQKFLWYYFILSYDKLRDLAKGGNQPNLNGNMIKDFPVLMPPIEMQNEYVSFVLQIDKSKFVVKQQIADLQELMDLKMQEYFGG